MVLTFVDRVKKYFDYLESEYGFKITLENNSEVRPLTDGVVEYTSDTTVVVIDSETGYAAVWFCRIKDGKRFDLDPVTIYEYLTTNDKKKKLLLSANPKDHSAATAYALDEKRKRREEEAQQKAQAEADADAKNVATQASLQAKIEAKKVQGWLEGQSILNAQIEEAKKKGATDDQISSIRQIGATEGLDVAISSAVNLTESIRDAALLQVQNARMEAKMTRVDADEDKQWAETQKNKAEQEQQARDAETARWNGLASQGQYAANVPSQEKSWWEKSWEGFKNAADKTILWVDQHQTEIAIGIGVVAGVAAVVLTAGTATPFVVALGGAMLTAGGIVAAGTLGLNAYYERPVGENVLRNIVIAASVAGITAGVGLFIAGGGSIASYLYSG